MNEWMNEWMDGWMDWLMDESMLNEIWCTEAVRRQKNGRTGTGGKQLKEKLNMYK